MLGRCCPDIQTNARQALSLVDCEGWLWLRRNIAFKLDTKIVQYFCSLLGQGSEKIQLVFLNEYIIWIIRGGIIFSEKNMFQLGCEIDFRSMQRIFNPSLQETASVVSMGNYPSQSGRLPFIARKPATSHLTHH